MLSPNEIVLEKDGVTYVKSHITNEISVLDPLNLNEDNSPLIAELTQSIRQKYPRMDEFGNVEAFICAARYIDFYKNIGFEKYDFAKTSKWMDPRAEEHIIDSIFEKPIYEFLKSGCFPYPSYFRKLGVQIIGGVYKDQYYYPRVLTDRECDFINMFNDKFTEDDSVNNFVMKNAMCNRIKRNLPINECVSSYSWNFLRRVLLNNSQFEQGNREDSIIEYTNVKIPLLVKYSSLEYLAFYLSKHDDIAEGHLLLQINKWPQIYDLYPDAFNLLNCFTYRCENLDYPDMDFKSLYEFVVVQKKLIAESDFVSLFYYAGLLSYIQKNNIEGVHFMLKFANITKLNYGIIILENGSRELIESVDISQNIEYRYFWRSEDVERVVINQIPKEEYARIEKVSVSNKIKLEYLDGCNVDEKVIHVLLQRFSLNILIEEILVIYRWYLTKFPHGNIEHLLTSLNKEYVQLLMDMKYEFTYEHVESLSNVVITSFDRAQALLDALQYWDCDQIYLNYLKQIDGTPVFEFNVCIQLNLQRSYDFLRSLNLRRPGFTFRNAQLGILTDSFILKEAGVWEEIQFYSRNVDQIINVLLFKNNYSGIGTVAEYPVTDDLEIISRIIPNLNLEYCIHNILQKGKNAYIHIIKYICPSRIRHYLNVNMFSLRINDKTYEEIFRVRPYHALNHIKRILENAIYNGGQNILKFAMQMNEYNSTMDGVLTFYKDQKWVSTDPDDFIEVD